MKLRMHQLIRIPILIIIMLIAGSCSSNQSEKEAQKLLEKQKSALEESEKLLDETFKEVQVFKDSLENEQLKLVNRRNQVERDLEELESNKEQYAETLKEDQQEELSQQKADLQNRLKTIEDSIALVQEKRDDILKEKDTIEIKEQQLSEQKTVSREKLVTGIDDIDNRLDKIDEQRLLKLNEIELNEQKINLARKKIELLEDEKNIYQREKNKLLKNNGDEAELEKYDLKISEINGYLKDEQNKIKSAESNINTLKEWIADADAMKEKLKDMMDSEYSRDETIAEFTREEISRLKNERQMLDTELKDLTGLKGRLSEKRASLNETLLSLEEKSELVKSKELSEILAERAGLEKQEAELAVREKEMVQQKAVPEEIAGITEVFSGSDILKSIEESVELKRKQIDILRYEIAEDEAQLAKQKSDIETRRAKNVRNITLTIVIFVIAGIVLVGALYTIGRRRRKTGNK